MKVFWILGGVFFTVGMGLLAGALLAWNSSASFAAHATTTEGVVVDQAYHSSSKGGTYSPVVEFTTLDGHKIHVTGSVGSGSPSYARGDRVNVMYDPANPERARLDTFSETWFLPLLLGGMGTVFAAVGAGFLLVQIRRRKVRAWLAQNGMRVQAKFDGVDYDTRVRVNGRSPWRMRCQWQHPVTQKVYIFRSDPIWFDPAPFVKRDALDVVVNADDPRQYQVDTSFLPAKG